MVAGGGGSRRGRSTSSRYARCDDSSRADGFFCVGGGFALLLACFVSILRFFIYQLLIPFIRLWTEKKTHKYIKT